MLWARPDRMFCTRAHYADTPHCRPRGVPSLTPARLPNPATHSPSLQYPPSSPWHPAAPPKPPARASCPRAEVVLILPLVGTLSSPLRCPATTATAVADELIFCRCGAASSRYIKGPRAPPSTHATSDFPRRDPRAVDRPERTASSNSGQLGRRQAPVRFVATGHPLAQPAPPKASP